MKSQDPLRDLWISQPSPTGANGDDMVTMVQERTRRFNRTIKMRNISECVAAAAVAVFFGFQSSHQPNVVAKIGFIVVALAGAWIIFYILRYGRAVAAIDHSQSLKAFADALSASYDHQIRLLKSVKYWYLLPMYVGLLIVSAGIFMERSKTGTQGWRDIVAPAIYTAIFGAIWWVNEVPGVARLRKLRANLGENHESTKA